MSENKIFIAAGGEFVNDKNSWQHICKEKLNYDILDLTKEKISNALISRNVIYKVNELFKMNYKTDDQLTRFICFGLDIQQKPLGRLHIRICLLFRNSLR